MSAKQTFIHSIIPKAGRYFVVGGICALSDWIFFSALLYLADLHYFYSATVSFIVLTGLNYVLSVKYVFDRGRRSRHQEIFLVYVVSIFGMVINLGVLSGLIELAGVHPLISKMFGTGAAFGWNFGARYFWIFGR